ncbi:Motif C-terminal to PAS motifs [Teratosphaeria destructans]|uniref:Motif C-terminal to PAS motifs n=1 Tax=Teratosphaeria destructans TaxID=418781 RepID=A0A9W7W4Y2_9PEZI|nr:Motif C-terminal to PAS motifs [Teratosphaeria destructans]
MDAPDVPRSRDGTQREIQVMRQEMERLQNDKKKKTMRGSTLTSFIKYPHSTKDGKRELRMGSKSSLNDRPGSSTSWNTANGRRDSQKPASVQTDETARDTTDDQAYSPSNEVHDTAGGDRRDRYLKSIHPAYRGHKQLDSRDFAQTKQPMSNADFDRPGISPDFSDFEDANGMPLALPPDNRTRDSSRESARRGASVPARNTRKQDDGPRSSTRPKSAHVHPGNRMHSVASSPEMPELKARYDAGDRSSAESVFSQETTATSIHTLPPLQTKGPDNSDAQQLEPVIEDDPRSFDLVAPPSDDPNVGIYLLERRAELMFSAQHLHVIFEDPKLLLKFTGFLNVHRPQSIPVLIYYLDALKALRAIDYANAIAEALDPIKGHRFTQHVVPPTLNNVLEEKANHAFDVLVKEDLPAYIAHTWISVVSVSIQRRITGTLAPHLREASEGLAEVFCLTDPSRADHPIVFASEEFTRTTQYGMGYVIGRNCRFLQGPKTSPHSVRRLAEACQAGRELTEVFVNYRRDGSPFMNLLMIAPLMDSRGTIRYYIGAQVDVSGLIKDCAELDGLTTLVEREQDPESAAEEAEMNKKDEFQNLSEMFNGAELETVRRYGGRMHKEYSDESDSESMTSGRRRLMLRDQSPEDEGVDVRGSFSSSTLSKEVKERLNGKLEGVYQHYLLVRPAPSLRILFTSPSLRVPGILQSPFLNRIGGSSRVRSDLAAALGEGRGVTAKIRWLTKADADGDGEGRPRWIHCTPLLGHSGAVGVWMIVLVDEESAKGQSTGRRFRNAPPVATSIGGREWDSQAYTRSKSRDRNHQSNRYDVESERRGGGGGGLSTFTQEKPGGGSVSVTRMDKGEYSMPNPNANGAAQRSSQYPDERNTKYSDVPHGSNNPHSSSYAAANPPSTASSRKNSGHIMSQMAAQQRPGSAVSRKQGQRVVDGSEDMPTPVPSDISFGLKTPQDEVPRRGRGY